MDGGGSVVGQGSTRLSPNLKKIPINGVTINDVFYDYELYYLVGGSDCCSFSQLIGCFFIDLFSH